MDQDRHRQRLKQLLDLPLGAKVRASINRIRQWYEMNSGMVYVGYSGGLDSTALGHLVRSVYSDVPFVFHNSPMEFPENRQFAKAAGAVFTNPKMALPEVFEKYGYPVVSKRVSQYIDEARRYPGSATAKRRLTGFTSSGKFIPMAKIPSKWRFLLRAPFNISHRCCDVFKKRPAAQYRRKTGRVSILGVRADESQGREQIWYRYGCNAPHLKSPRSWPIAFWTHDDVWEYIRAERIPYSPLYDMGYRRSGCMFCLFGIHMEGRPNRIQLLAKTHPACWRYCMDKLGLREVLRYLRIPGDPKPMFDFGGERA